MVIRIIMQILVLYRVRMLGNFMQIPHVLLFRMPQDFAHVSFTLLWGGQVELVRKSQNVVLSFHYKSST